MMANPNVANFPEVLISRAVSIISLSGISLVLTHFSTRPILFVIVTSMLFLISRYLIGQKT
jgi:hypothetical protein